MTKEKENQKEIQNQNDNQNQEKNQNKNGRKSIKKIVLIILSCIILLALTAIISCYIFLENKLNKINYVEINKDDIAVNTDVAENLSSYRNIALLGLDSLNNSYSGCRSDAIMIVSLNNNTNDVKIVSVYRDTYLDISPKSANSAFLDKITHAYAYGEATQTLTALNRNLDLNITEFATLNFSALIDAVDSIGGIDLYISEEEVQYKFSKNITQAGTYHLNGTETLNYCSNLHTEGGDYKRTERMRTVLTKIFEKAKTLDAGELNKLVDAVFPHISTNITKDEIYSLIPNIAKYNVTDTIGWPYDVDADTSLGVWYGVPTHLIDDVSKLHYVLFGEENYEVSDTVKQISAEIEKKISGI